MMDMTSDTTTSLLAVLFTVASIMFSIMVMSGLLVPRWVYRQVVSERDRWRDDARDCSATVAASQIHQQMLLETVQQLQRELGQFRDHPQETGG